MKYFSLILLLGLLLQQACVDEVDFPIDQRSGEFVVDGFVDIRPQKQIIRLSQTQGFFDNSGIDVVSDAVVTVHNVTTAQSFPFVYDPDDFGYIWLPDSTRSSLGSVGDSMLLSIQYGDASYSAATRVYRVAPIDSIYQEFRTDDVFFDDGIYLELFARDLDGLGDRVWIKSFRNGRFINNADQINLAYDASFDEGAEIDGLIYIFTIRFAINDVDEDSAPIPWEVGDTSRVEMHSLNDAAFQFWNIARDQITNGSNGIFQLPTANTVTNIVHENGDSQPVGIFNVSAVSEITHVVE